MSIVRAVILAGHVLERPWSSWFAHSTKRESISAQLACLGRVPTKGWLLMRSLWIHGNGSASSTRFNSIVLLTNNYYYNVLEDFIKNAARCVISRLKDSIQRKFAVFAKQTQTQVTHLGKLFEWWYCQIYASIYGHPCQLWSSF